MDYQLHTWSFPVIISMKITNDKEEELYGNVQRELGWWKSLMEV
ncbi:hypothetical protein [Breznakia pachnodae]|uniref:Uncharacterized protein n=1 Tax=Breznakia pachnodae TaxID=265178 RepID=A0ABU0E2T3_9FIRM|nr:hypothetical protein [Breznakia pachnodae]MDQ0361198.1 hypothetical protein [Breznakia pachnodae]